MNFVCLIFSWLLGIFFLLLTLLSIWSGNYIPSIFVLIGTLLLIPPIRKWISEKLKISIPLWLRSLVLPILFIAFVYFIFLGMGNKYSIYKNPEIESKLMAIYDARMHQWPLPYQSRYIDTKYGKVFVVMSGPEDAPPVVLLHASAMASWSWLYNVAGLNQYYRTFAIDMIGDAGRSKLRDINQYPKDGEELASLFSEIMDSLKIERAHFIGASQGGFCATNLALYHPGRVDKLILSGPMGYTGTNLSVLQILLTTMFPIKPLQVRSLHWAFGDDPKVLREVSDWFYLILQGVVSRQARPMPFSLQQMQQLNQPVLLLLGTKDGLVGNPENTRKVAQNIRDVRVEILEAGHLISAEKPNQFNELVLNFIAG